MNERQVNETQYRLDETQHNLAAKAIFALMMFALSGLILSQAPTAIRVIALCMGVSTSMIVGIVYYVFKKRGQYGE